MSQGIDGQPHVQSPAGLRVLLPRLAVLLVGAALAALWAAGPAQTTSAAPPAQAPEATGITYNRDITLPAGHTYLVGLEAAGSQCHGLPANRMLIATEYYYPIPSRGVDGPPCKAGVNFPDIGVSLSPVSRAAALSPNFIQLSGGFGFSVFLYTYRHSPPEKTDVPFTGMSSKPIDIAVKWIEASGSTPPAADTYALFLCGSVASPEGCTGYSLWRHDGTTDEWIGGGVTGSGDGEMDNPVALEVGPDGLVYVLDLGNSRVQVFSADGDYVRQFPLLSGVTATDGFDIGPDGRVYVSDGSGGGVAYEADGSVVGSFGTTVSNPPPGPFGPHFILVDPDGKALLVFDGTGLHEYLIAAPYTFIGFESPTKDAPELNHERPGSLTYLRYQVLKDGQPVTDLTSVEMTAQEISCDTHEPTGDATTSEVRSLHYGRGNYFLYFSIPRNWEGTCQEVSIGLGDGVPHSVLYEVEGSSRLDALRKALQRLVERFGRRD